MQLNKTWYSSPSIGCNQKQAETTNLTQGTYISQLHSPIHGVSHTPLDVSNCSRRVRNLMQSILPTSDATHQPMVLITFHRHQPMVLITFHRM